MITREKALGILKKSGCSKKVIAHCIAVSELASEMASVLKSEGQDVDLSLVEIGGILHDLGRAESHGISHAVLGARMAEKYDLCPEIQEIIKRHIGAGISREEAKEFGLPDDDYMPITLEQKIVAHADNLVKGTKRISLEKRVSKMQEDGLDSGSIERVKALAAEIGIF